MLASLVYIIHGICTRNSYSIALRKLEGDIGYCTLIGAAKMQMQRDDG